jgi:hypothetical protein
LINPRSAHAGGFIIDKATTEKLIVITGGHDVNWVNWVPTEILAGNQWLEGK